MKFNKKYLFYFISLTLIIFLAFISFKTKTKDDNIVKWLVYSGAQNKDLDKGEYYEYFKEIEEEINKYLKSNKAYSLKITNKAYSEDYMEEIKNKSEEYDIISIIPIVSSENLNLISPFYYLYTNNKLFSLDEFYTKNKEVLYENIPKEEIERSKIDGHLYGLSSSIRTLDSAVYDKKLIDKYNISKKELTSDIFNHLDIYKEISIKEKAPIAFFNFFGHEMYNKYMNTDFASYIIFKDDKFQSIYELKEIKEFYKKALYLYQEKIITFDPKLVERNFFDVSSGLYNFQPFTRDDYYYVPKVVKDLYWGDIRVSAINKSSIKESSLDFLKTLFTDKDIANIISGRTINLKDKTSKNIFFQFIATRLTNNLINNSGGFLAEEEPKDKLAYQKEYFSVMDKSLPVGFRFSAIPFEKEVRKLNELTGEYEEAKSINLKKLGRLEFKEEELSELLANLNLELQQAGIDKVIAGLNDAYKEFKDEK